MRTMTLGLVTGMVLVTVLFSLASEAHDEKKQAYKSGDTVKEFKLPDRDGKEYKLSDFKGKPLFINFYRAECGKCRDDAKFIETEIWQAMKKDGLSVIGITLDEPGQVKAFIEEFKLTYPILIDKNREVFKAFGVTGIPHTAVIRADGKVSWNHVLGDEKTLTEQAYRAIQFMKLLPQTGLPKKPQR